MRLLTIFIIIIIGHFDLLGQNEKILTVNSDSLEYLYSKEVISRKIFKLLKLDYDYFVNPGEEFNSTDLQSPKVPGCRLIVCLRDKDTVIVFYECGSYYGALTDCQIGIKATNGFERYTPIERIRNKDELVTMIEAGTLKMTRVNEKNNYR